MPNHRSVIHEDEHYVYPLAPWVEVNKLHQYRVQGMNLNPKGVELAMTSVSTIAGLVSGFDGKRWAAKLALEHNDVTAYEKVSAGFAETGNIHHRHIKNLALSGTLEEYMDSLGTPWGLNYEMFTGWILHMKERGIEPTLDFLATEMYVYNQTLKYGGQLDAIALYQGNPTIFDWKTTTKGGASIKSASHAVQVGGYYLALQEMIANQDKRCREYAEANPASKDGARGYPFKLPEQAFVVYSFRDAPRELQFEKVNIEAAVEVFQQAQRIHSGKAKGGLYVKSPTGSW